MATPLDQHGSLRQQAKDATRSRLLRSLATAVTAGGGNVRVADVIKLAEISQGTFYLHFSSLDEAVEARLAELLSDAAAAATETTEGLDTALRIYNGELGRNREELSALAELSGSRRLRPRRGGPSSTSAWAAMLLRQASLPEGTEREDQRAAAEMVAQLIELEALRSLIDPSDQTGQPAIKPALTLGVLASLVRHSLSIIGSDTPSELLHEFAGSAARVRFIAVDDRRLSAPELQERTQRACALLTARGFTAGDRVCLLLQNNFAVLEISAAAAQLGITTIPTNTYWRPAEVEHVLRTSNATGVIFHDDFRSVVDGLSADLQRGLLLLSLGSSRNEERYEAELLAHDCAAVQPDQEQVTILFTSGSTMMSKGVVRAETGEERRRHALFLASLFDITDRDVVLVAGPHHHSGNRAFVAAARQVGASLVMMGSFDAERMLRLIERERVTVVIVVPTMLYRTLDLGPGVIAGFDLSSLRIVVHAASPCAPELKRRAMATFGPIVWEYFGTTEIGGTIIGPADWIEHSGSVGRAWDPGTHVAVFDDHGIALPDQVVGDVGILDRRRAPFEYIGAHEPAAFTPDGYFLTGDLGYLDADGYLYLSDRKRFVIKSGGVPVYPSEVEFAISSSDDVEDCFVAAAPDIEWGEAVVAFVQPRSPETFDLSRLRGQVREKLAHYKCPRQWYIVESVPRDGAGKLLRTDAEALLSKALNAAGNGSRE